jgi:hypothetical protein
MASEGDDQANSFVRHYASTCLKHITNFESLRQALKPIPALPPEKSQYFLGGYSGDAWSVPDNYGTFVLALPTGKNLCSLAGRRANTETVIKLFTSLVTNPPAPLISKQVGNKQEETTANGLTQTVSYEWSVPGQQLRFLFILTTAPSESANLQVLGSASVSYN